MIEPITLTILIVVAVLLAASAYTQIILTEEKGRARRYPVLDIATRVGVRFTSFFVIGFSLALTVRLIGGF